MVSAVITTGKAVSGFFVYVCGNFCNSLLRRDLASRIEKPSGSRYVEVLWLEITNRVSSFAGPLEHSA